MSEKLGFFRGAPSDLYLSNSPVNTKNCLNFAHLAFLTLRNLFEFLACLLLLMRKIIIFGGSMRNLILSSLCLFGVASFMSCSQHSTGRMPASVEEVDFISPDLYQTTENVRDLLAVEEMGIDVCHNEIAKSFSKLRGLKTDYFKMDYNEAEYAVIIERLWSIKQNIRRHVQNWSQKNVMDRKCAKAAKAAMRASRYIEQNASLIYLAKKGQNVDGFNSEDKSPMFSKGFPWTMSDKGDFNMDRDLRSGDVLLWRGTSAISASIARLGDSENNFSHVSIVYIDPKTKRRYNIEALIETGMIMQDFTTEPLHPGSGKVVVFRHKDQKIAKKAAEFAYGVAKKTIGTKNHLNYDFGFDLVNRDTVFCSEVVHWAFKEASNGKVMIPQFLTKFDMKNRKFLNDLGTNAQTGYQPGDTELEPSFDMIAEWRNLHYSRSNHLKDIIMSNVYRWMDDYNYNFKGSFRGSVIGPMVFGMRRVPVLGGLVEGKLPLNMSFKTLKSVLTLQKVVDDIYKELFKRLYKKNSNRVLSMADIEAELEKFRLEDLEIYKAQIKANRNSEAHYNPEFHHNFGPPKKSL